MSERATEGSEFAEWQPAATGHPLGEKAATMAGPYDAHDDDPPDYHDGVDLGPLVVRLPADAHLLVDNTAGTVARTAHLTLPAGKVDLSVLAAPRGSRLWPQIAEEVTAVQGDRGARVDAESGEWGQELRAVSADELSWFIGVDGPRWMLYGVATGPVDADAELAATLRELLRGTVVRRGSEPLPVKTPLVLTAPDERAAEQSREPATRSVVKEPVWFRMGPTPSDVAVPVSAGASAAPRLTAVPDAPEPAAPAAPLPAAQDPTQVGPAAAAASTEPDRPWPLPVEVHDWRPTVPPAGVVAKRRVGRWALPAGPSVGVAGLVLLVGVGTAWVAVRATRTPTAEPAALPDPTTALTTPGPATPPDAASALPDPAEALPDPATALTNPGPQPTNTLPGLPGLVPPAPPPSATGPRPATALAGSNRSVTGAVGQARRGVHRAEQAVGADRPSDNGDEESGRLSDRSDGDERSTYPGLLGGLVSALNPAQLGIG
jgi:hypothetical protein